MSKTKSSHCIASGLLAFLTDVVPQSRECCGLFGLKLFDRGHTLGWRQGRIDLRDATMNVCDDARFGSREQRREVTGDRRNLGTDFGTMGGIEQLTLGGEHAADRLARCRLLSCGLSGFRGFLARPFQKSRYRSRSKSLPLSRSSQ